MWRSLIGLSMEEEVKFVPACAGSEVEATGVLEETFLCGFTGWAKGRRIFG